MATRLTRKIVKIDEERCDGCGDCIPNCVEGALRIIDGKARLVAEKLCDGMGACLGKCPRGAITIEERPADEFDEAAAMGHGASHHDHAERHAHTPAAPAAHAERAEHTATCPGARVRMLRPPAPVEAAGPERPSRLGQWPVQLTLVPPGGPMWQDADVLIAADCVPFAYADFHDKLLAGKTVAIACPKLDDVGPYIQKLAAIFASSSIRSITVVHMEVPCCTGILRVVQAALAQAERTDIPVKDIVIGIDGTVQRDV